MVLKKSKTKNVFEESDSDPDGDTNADTVNTQQSLESDEENKEKKATDRVKPRRIRAALLDSDESDCDEDVPNGEVNDIGATTDKDFSKQKKSSKKQTGLEVKEKCKSKRMAEKARKKMASTEKSKRDKQNAKVSNMRLGSHASSKKV